MAKKTETYIAASLLDIGSRTYRPGEKIRKIEETEVKEFLGKGMIYLDNEDEKTENPKLDVLKAENEELKITVGELKKQLEEVKAAAEKAGNENEVLKEKIEKPEKEQKSGTAKNGDETGAGGDGDK